MFSKQRVNHSLQNLLAGIRCVKKARQSKASLIFRLESSSKEFKKIEGAREIFKEKQKSFLLYSNMTQILQNALDLRILTLSPQLSPFFEQYSVTHNSSKNIKILGPVSQKSVSHQCLGESLPTIQWIQQSNLCCSLYTIERQDLCLGIRYMAFNDSENPQSALRDFLTFTQQMNSDPQNHFSKETMLNNHTLFASFLQNKYLLYNLHLALSHADSITALAWVRYPVRQIQRAVESNNHSFSTLVLYGPMNPPPGQPRVGQKWVLSGYFIGCKQRGSAQNAVKVVLKGNFQKQVIKLQDRYMITPGMYLKTKSIGVQICYQQCSPQQFKQLENKLRAISAPWRGEGFILINYQHLKAISFLRQRELIVARQYSRNQGYTLFYLAFAEFKSQQFEDCIKHLKKCLNLFLMPENSREIAQTHRLLAQAYSSIQNYQSSIQHFSAEMRLTATDQDRFRINNSLAHSYRQLDQFASEYKHLYQAKNIIQFSPSLKDKLADAYADLGVSSFNQNKYLQAKQQLLLSKQLYQQQSQSRQGLASVEFYLGLSQYFKGQFHESLQHFNRNIELEEGKCQNQHYNYISCIYLMSLSKFLKRKQLKEVNQLRLDVFQQVYKSKDPQTYLQFLEKVSQTMIQVGKPSKAIKYIKKALSLSEEGQPQVHMRLQQKFNEMGKTD